MSLDKNDPQIKQLIKQEINRQREGLKLIPSENFVSPAVLQTLGSPLTNKYSEGYPGKRYYGGNQFIDQIETLVQERAKQLFRAEHVNVHPSPFPFTDIVTTTTHKTLRGPRGALIMCKKQFAPAIDKMVFPGMQGGPHNHQTAAIGVALQEATQPSFQEYARQIVSNAKALAASLTEEGLKLVSGGTDNHLILIDLTKTGITGQQAETALEQAGLYVNKNMIPHDPRSPLDPSGIRLGTPALTTRGFKEKDMKKNRTINQSGN